MRALVTLTDTKIKLQLLLSGSGSDTRGRFKLGSKQTNAYRRGQQQIMDDSLFLVIVFVAKCVHLNVYISWCLINEFSLYLN